MTTQKAYRLHSYGGPECIRLDDVPVPTPGTSQVLVAVSAVGMNPFDWKVREGYAKDFMHLNLPATMGVDFVGTVAALGEGSSRFKIGDRVMTLSTSLGAYAEHIAVDEAILARVPDGLGDIEAATLPIPGLTAWTAMYEAGDPQPGMRVLIHGASGTTGAFAVQFAKAAGAYVIGTASGKNRDYVLGLGADEFIDYRTETFEKRVKDIDLVLDFVLLGGDMNTTDRSWIVLKPNGAIVSVADPAILGKIPDGHRGFFPHIQADANRLETIADQLARGEIKSKVARVFRRAELLDAMAINQAGGTTGRLIVDFKIA
ncbi:NADP-dependent oxidoreductase [Acidisoma cellulosilytica]|uniref:NADP-dependent oxidoreductase n=1 Tax=Acidisoma cellulosilyticum TaxID=2802395 RepID=A0A963Z5R3_9PROT|nr:NADP-dependent oxidoreductase [Acidisoma cellulosilyticum]MCB8882342.1 NADP-dependent oxidoreductase [Acidisoma cellulosilyticum]